MKYIGITLIFMLCSVNDINAQYDQKQCKSILEGGPFDYRVGHLGCPSSNVDFEMAIPVPWTKETIQQFKNLGFNTIQLNVAWGSRPGDEPLNIEDIVQLSTELDRQYPQVVPLRSKPGDEARDKRRMELQKRIKLCREAGLRTIFHFGAPYNAHARYGDCPPNSLMDPKVTRRYVLLLETFAREFPGVDDILIYTYDQDAWLSNEFNCEGSLGIPLHERVVPFLDALNASWQKLSPGGRLWWEPWELSAGQVITCVEQINPEGFGLAVHANIAEVMATLPVDRWLKNTVTIARQRNIPVIVEYFLGSPSQELETIYHFPCPLVTLRGLQAIASIPGVTGIKEYFGLDPTCEDPNLRMTSIFFRNPAIPEAEALNLLAKPYGKASDKMKELWRLTSEGMELFPWETSWYMGQIGRSRTDHALSAAFLRGGKPPTPSWFSTRQAIFMKNDPQQPHPWMLEDVQLRCQAAAKRWEAALAVGNECKGHIPVKLAGDFDQILTAVTGVRRRALAYAYHIRETNLATVLRKATDLKIPMPQRSIDELLSVMEADLKNHNEEIMTVNKADSSREWEDMEQAIALLKQDVNLFLQKYLIVTEDAWSKGPNSVTSR